jgi:hypothetical protein
MPYEFREWEEELEPQPSSARLGLPPRKPTGIDVIDPPGPPKRLPGPLAALPASFLMRLLVGLILTAVVLMLLGVLFAR